MPTAPEEYGQLFIVPVDQDSAAKFMPLLHRCTVAELHDETVDACRGFDQDANPGVSDPGASLRSREQGLRLRLFEV